MVLLLGVMVVLMPRLLPLPLLQVGIPLSFACLVIFHDYLSSADFQLYRWWSLSYLKYSLRLPLVFPAGLSCYRIFS